MARRSLCLLWFPSFRCIHCLEKWSKYQLQRKFFAEINRKGEPKWSRFEKMLRFICCCNKSACHSVDTIGVVAVCGRASGKNIKVYKTRYPAVSCFLFTGFWCDMLSLLPPGRWQRSIVMAKLRKSEKEKKDRISLRKCLEFVKRFKDLKALNILYFFSLRQ